ncbi:hypothetical protein MTO96_042370 [Rhipicephalus appendiculatus]
MTSRTDVMLADFNRKIADITAHGAEYEEEVTVAPENHKICSTMSRDRYLLKPAAGSAGSTAPGVDPEAGLKESPLKQLRQEYEAVRFSTSCLDSLGVQASEYAVILHRVLMRSLPKTSPFFTGNACRTPKNTTAILQG